MKRCTGLVILCLLAFPVMAFAQADLPDPAVLGGVDLTTIAGIVGVAWIIIQMLVSFVPALGASAQRKRLTALVVVLALGLLAKFTGLGFVDADLVTFILNLVIAATAMQPFHSAVANPVKLAVKPEE